MNKLITIIAIALLSLNATAQKGKIKAYKQFRKVKTGRYITNKEVKVNPSTTYYTRKKMITISINKIKSVKPMLEKIG